jgi:hypothetical protein
MRGGSGRLADLLQNAPHIHGCGDEGKAMIRISAPQPGQVKGKVS